MASAAFLQRVGDGLLQGHRSALAPGCSKRFLAQSSSNRRNAVIVDTVYRRQRMMDPLAERPRGPEEPRGAERLLLGPGELRPPPQAAGAPLTALTFLPNRQALPDKRPRCREVTLFESDEAKIGECVGNESSSFEFSADHQTFFIAGTRRIILTLKP